MMAGVNRTVATAITSRISSGNMIIRGTTDANKIRPKEPTSTRISRTGTKHIVRGHNTAIRNRKTVAGDVLLNMMAGVNRTVATAITSRISSGNMIIRGTMDANKIRTQEPTSTRISRTGTKHIVRGHNTATPNRKTVVGDVLLNMMAGVNRTVATAITSRI